MMDERLISACAEILLSPPCQQIDFKWRGQHISAHGYRTVVFAVMEGRIGTGIGHDLKPGEAAIKAIIDALLDDPRFLDEKRNVPFVDWDGFADPVFP
jgi:hypothetical protein